MRNKRELVNRQAYKRQMTIGTPDIYAPTAPADFSKIKVGMKTLSDATLTLGEFPRLNRRLGDKKAVLEAIHNLDYSTMRDISEFFYRTSGIYNRLCRYAAYLYRYDWYVTPYVNSDKAKPDKILKDFNNILTCLEEFEVKKFLGDVALKVIRHGCYYGYKFSLPNGRIAVQELPPKYCRSRFAGPNGQPIVEFNMKFFDEKFRDTIQRQKMLKLFPPEFKRGYDLFHQHKLIPDYPGDEQGWYLLDPEATVKFNLNGDDFPPFIAVIPAILDLDAAQDLDRRKMQQQLLKIIIQKMPLDKNNDLVFDPEEVQVLHNNAVRMLGRAIGVDVLTTFAEVDVADMADKVSNATADALAKVERTVYNEAGVSQMQFNTDGNIALEKSILNDEASLYNLVQQFESFLNGLLDKYNTTPKKVSYRCQILTTTIYNYKEMAKLFKEQTQLGYSKMLPQIALGQSQRSVLATAFFENDILDLVNVFIPPLMSSTMNADTVQTLKDGGKPQNMDKEGAGRPEKEDDQKAEKTIQNKEAQN